MATSGVARTVPDANILVYYTVPTSPFHAAAVAKMTAATAAGEVWVSRQIVREYLAVMTRPGAVVPPPDPLIVLANASYFLTQYRVAEDGAAVSTELFALLSAVPCGGKQVHDANIVATMRAYGVPDLLTHNVQDFKRFAGYITVVPLVP